MAAPLLATSKLLRSHPGLGYTPVPYVTGGATPNADWPISNLNNGMAGLSARLTGASCGFSLDCGRAISPEVAAVFNTTIFDSGTVALQGSTVSNFVSTVYNQPWTGGRNAWKDLRVAAPTARYWRALCTAPSGEVQVGELVLANLTTCPEFLWGTQVSNAYASRDLGTTPYNVRHRRAYGSKAKRRVVRFNGNRVAMQALTEAVKANARDRWPWLFVPDPSGTDVLWLEIPANALAQSVIEDGRWGMTLTVSEQAVGA